MRKVVCCFLVSLFCGTAWADTKISAMSSTTTLNSGDVIPVVTNPGTSPANFNITKSNLITTLGLSSYGLLSSTQTWTGGNTFSSATITTLNGVTPGLVAGTNITSITGVWPNQTINATTQGGGGTSALAVTTGTISAFGWAGSSPTAAIVANGAQFAVSLQGGATAFLTLLTSSVTLQGNAYNIANIAADTGTINSTVSKLTSSMTAVGIATGTLNTSVTNLTSSMTATWTTTGTLTTSVNQLTSSMTATWVTTGTLTTSVNALNASMTGKVNYASFTVTDPLQYNNTTGAISINKVSLSTGVMGTLPAGNMVSTAAFITSSQTISGQYTHSSTIIISTTIGLGGLGTTGNAGQFLTSQGPASQPTWTSGNAGTITGVVAGTGLTGGGTSGSVTLTLGTTVAFTVSTQTFSGGTTFNSWTTQAGSMTATGIITSTAIYVSSATIGTDEYSNGTYTAISTISWQNGNMQKVTLTANTAFNFIAPAHPGTLTLRILTGSGSFACTWPGTAKWSGGTGPTITVTASKVDFCIFKYASDGNYYGSCSGTQNF